MAELTHIDRSDLLYPPITPRVPSEIRSARSITQAIRNGDILLYHPYDSFAPVVDFVRAAANDPEVLAIKQTLYRVGSNSPIVETLSEARDEQTQVAVLVELKARFDEEPNITWARQLEARGVHVAYGIVGLKTHAKISLVVRREGSGLKDTSTSVQETTTLLRPASTRTSPTLPTTLSSPKTALTYSTT